MTRTTNANFKEKRDSPSVTYAYLYSVYEYDGENDLHFINDKNNLIYDGITYNYLPVTHDNISENISGQVDVVRIKLSNISRLIQAYLESYNFTGLKVTIKTVLDVTDPLALLTDTYYIDSYTADQKDVEFICTSKLDLINTVLPLRRFSREYCLWIFKSAECGYIGAELECNKTFQRCKELNNRLRFGGFPSIKSNKIYS